MATPLFRSALLAACLSAIATIIHAQTANCTFQPVPMPSNITKFQPAGINDYGNVVGTAESKTGQKYNGFIQYNDGNFKTFAFNGNLQTAFTKRNNRGVTVGYFKSPALRYHGMVYSNGAATRVDYPGSFQTQLTGINSDGTIVGYYFTATGELHGFQFAKGAFSPVEYQGKYYSAPVAINDNGVIVGYYQNLNSNVVHGFILENGVYHTLNNPKDSTGAGNIFPSDINNSGSIVGYYSVPTSSGAHAFWYKKGIFEDIVMPDGTSAYAFGINSQNQVAGMSYVKGQPTPVRYIATCQ
jgi:probable HAF family extracellular repeat protein